MNVEFMPKIRLEIDSMKASIIQCLGVHNSELEKIINEQVEKSLLEYNWEEDINNCVQQCIHEAIHNLFNYGDGSKLINKAVRDIFIKGQEDDRNRES